MRNIPIRLSVMAIFFVIVSVMFSILYLVQAHFSEELARNAIKSEFHSAANEIEEKIKNTNETSQALLKTSALFVEVTDSEDFFQNKEKYLKIFSTILEGNDSLYSVYIGFDDQSFYEIINLSINDKLAENYAKSKDDLWLEIVIQQGEMKQTNTYDKHFNQLSTEVAVNDYIVKSRPWYKRAVQEDSIVKVGPYKFSNIDSNGITYALNMANNNVFALDMLVSDLSSILKRYHDGKLLSSQLLHENGEMVATSNNDDSVFNKILERYEGKKIEITQQQSIKVGSNEYIYNLTKIESYNNQEYLLSYVSLDQMMSPYLEKFTRLNSYFLIVFIFFIPVIWLFSSFIIKPILLLVEESEKVKRREFLKVSPVNTFIKEANLLSTSIISMAHSINEHQTSLEEKVRIRTLELEKINKELEILSVTDKLTNTYNRIKLDATIDDKIKVQDKNFGVMIIDIDYFKQVNDTYGHQVGDMALIEFSNILKAGISEKELLGRWGGEEFVIIVTEGDLAVILELAESLRNKIDKHVFPVIGNKTASFGVSTYRAGESSEELINRADEALYLAKNNGRNRVETLESH